MNLEKISANIKPSNGWQSVDLGIQMARTWWKPLFGAWFIITLPVFLLLNVTVFINYNLPIFIFWWLKPFFESMLLFYISRALFGEFLTVRQTIREFPRQGRIQILRYLTYRRFSPYRSFTMPVSQLENIGKADRKQRIRLLFTKADVQVLGMFLVFLHFEFFLYMSLNSLLIIFIPVDMIEDFLTNFNFLQSNIKAGFSDYLINNFILYLVMGFVAPFHVAAGFSIYINRRAGLEGWDIELMFRRIAARYKKEQLSKRHLSNGLNKVTTLAILIFCSSAIYMVTPANAQQNLNKEGKIGPLLQHDQASAKEHIKEIITGDTFHEKKTITRYKFLENLLKPKKREKKTSYDLGKYLKGFLIWVARSFELILWILFIGLLITIVIKYRKWFREVIGFPELIIQKSKTPETLFGLDIKKDSLPDDIPTTVLKLWHEGNKRQGLSLLYRSTLSRLVTDHAFTFIDAYTEQECIDIVTKKKIEGIGEYFKILTAQWQLLAYGHKFPETNLIETLCQQWLTLFDSNSNLNGDADE